MIKGVNRRMIEVTHTGSPYFERAFLVVSPDSRADEAALQRLAEKVVHQGERCASLRRQRLYLWRRRVGFAALWSSVGAAVMWIVQHIEI